MTRRRIVDHQVSGKEKLAITRNKDRNLSSLDSIEDKKIETYISSWVGQWPEVGDESVPRLMRRSETPVQKEKRLARELSSAYQLKHTLTSDFKDALKKNDLPALFNIKKSLKEVNERIQRLLGNNNDKPV